MKGKAKKNDLSIGLLTILAISVVSFIFTNLIYEAFGACRPSDGHYRWFLLE